MVLVMLQGLDTIRLLEAIQGLNALQDIIAQLPPTQLQQEMGSVQQGIIVLQVRAVLLKMHVVQGIIVQPVQVPQHNALQDIMDLRLPTQ